MEESQTKSFTTPAWLQPMPNLWETFLIHFRSIVGWTFLILLVTAAITLVLPKTYRSHSTLLVLPPHYAESLDIPPQSLSMPSIQAIATSYPILQDLLADLTIKKSLYESVVLRLEEPTEEDSEVDLASVLAYSATEAAEFLQFPLNAAFEKAWSGMPPSGLAKGFSPFTEKELSLLGPNELSERLSARISTALETNLTTEYQPLLTLSADGGTPESAALLAYLWGNRVLRSLEEEIVGESVRIQNEKKQQWTRMVDLHRNAKMAPYEYLAYHPLDIWKSEILGREKRRTGGEGSPPSIGEGESLGESIRQSEAVLTRLRGDYYQSSKELDYFLNDLGGLEAQVEDFQAVFRADRLNTPTPPKKKISPRRAVIVLSVGAVAFFLLLGFFQLHEFRIASTSSPSS